MNSVFVRYEPRLKIPAASPSTYHPDGAPPQRLLRRCALQHSGQGCRMSSSNMWGSWLGLQTHLASTKEALKAKKSQVKILCNDVVHCICCDHMANNWRLHCTAWLEAHWQGTTTTDQKSVAKPMRRLRSTHLTHKGSILPIAIQASQYDCGLVATNNLSWRKLSYQNLSRWQWRKTWWIQTYCNPIITVFIYRLQLHVK